MQPVSPEKSCHRTRAGPGTSNWEQISASVFSETCKELCGMSAECQEMKGRKVFSRVPFPTDLCLPGKLVASICP